MALVRSRTRRRWAAAAVAGALVLGAAGCSGGGGDDEAAVDDEGVTGPPRTTAPARPGGGVGGDLETFEVFSNKNPFTPLAPTGGGGTGATGTGTTGTGTGTAGTGTTGTTGTGATGTGATGTGTTGTGTTGTGGTTSTTLGTGSGGSSEPQVGQRVALLDVFAEEGRTVANVRVNDTVYKVAAGDEFAGRYKVLSLSQADECGRFMFGDDAFRLCQGETTTK